MIWMQGWGGQIFVQRATVVKPNIWKMLRMMGDLLFLRRYGCNYIWLAIKYKVQAAVEFFFTAHQQRSVDGSGFRETEF